MSCIMLKPVELHYKHNNYNVYAIFINKPFKAILKYLSCVKINP